MNTITKEQAKALLKANGHKLKDVADYLGVQPRALTVRWRSGELNATQALMIKGYIAEHDETYKTMQRHKDNPALIALLSELDK